ncbi:MAG: radical SAM protein [Rhodospirillales bacterium]|jgi:putative pyruvate formate lyase activating enzyme|nr:radical SAM protein [Rhodospirillales bacterium]MDP6643667.1 radical SAM protein [Rhodospirillales bacterium]MDP6840270.1 radical SAM protein [Rhodospirillales bacterium]|tara:strand:+ start:1947 stop:3203 length:1257 start_codon:yes stop_codon:yes gene_type:complete
MNAFANLWIWSDEQVGKRMSWYRGVAANRLPAKFRIARTIPVDADLDADSEESLWAELERRTPGFTATREAIRSGREDLGPPARRPHLLDLARELSARMLAHCNFCAWDCGVDRIKGAKLGTCKLGAGTRVSTFFHHRGEELVYRGTSGSGTIFFTSCNMRCAFCQNGDISTDKDNGTEVSPRTLAAMAWLLRHEGCHNINWVGGDPIVHLHSIIAAISVLGDEMTRPSSEDIERAFSVKADFPKRLAIDETAAQFEGAFNAPMLWNSNSYASAEVMKILRLLVDVWLPDFKFGPGRCATELARTARYWETATASLSMIEAWKEDLTIRHLVMPGHVECCTYAVIDWIAEHMPDVPVNVMNQYHPDMFANPRSPRYREKYETVSRRLSEEELLSAYLYARQKRIAFEPMTFESQPEGA